MEPTTTPTGRAGITFEQVAAIADATAAQGDRPTLRGVRAELGTGSLGTIQRHLAAWQGSRRQIVTSSATLPTEIQRVILSEIERAVSEARADLEADLAATKGALAELADDNEAQAGQIEQQAAQLGESAAVGQQQIGRIAQLETDLTNVAEEIRREREEAANARQSLAKAELRLEAIPKIEAEAERRRVALETETASRVAAEQSAAVLRAQLEALRGQVEELRGARGKIEAERDQAREQAHQSQGEAREQARRIETQEAEIQALRAQVEGHRDARGKSEAERDQARAQAREQAAAMDALRSQIAKSNPEPEKAAPIPTTQDASELVLESSPIIDPLPKKKATVRRQTKDQTAPGA